MSTIPQLLLDWVARDTGESAFYARTEHVSWPEARDSASHPGWVEMNLAELLEMVSGMARRLQELGVEKGSKVAILSETSAMWSVIDLAIISLGGVTVGIYPTLPADQVRWLIEHSESLLLVAENHAQWSRLGDLSEIDSLKQTRLIWEHPDAPPMLQPGEPDLEFLREIIPRVQPSDLCTIVYTSGTTGEPKGAMLTHGNFVDVIMATVDVIPTQAGDRSIAFLPLAHSLQRFSLYRGLTEQIVGYFCGIEDLPDTIRIGRPHILVTVPRMLEKIQARIRAKALSRGPRAMAILEGAVRTGKEAARLRREGKRLPLTLRTRLALSERMVYRRIRQGLGGSIHTFISGGAALNPELARWFEAVGIEVLEGWGLTETSAPATANPPGKSKPGSVGPALPGVVVSLAEDGELLIESPGNFLGYFKSPEATAEAFTKEGAFRSGDLGTIDEDGYVWITGRKKSILVTAGGKNIAPVPIEKRLEQDLVGQAVVVGSERPYLVALLTLDPEVMEAEARRRGWEGGPQDWAERVDVRARLLKTLTDANHGRASFESVKKFSVLPRPLSVDLRELTPTLKLRRATIVQHFQDTIETLYDAPREEKS